MIEPNKYTPNKRNERDYHAGIAAGLYLADDRSAADILEDVRAVYHPTVSVEQRLNKVENLLGGRIPADHHEDFAWGVVRGLGQALATARRREDIRHIHAREQAEAAKQKPKQPKRPCIGCDKKTTAQDGMCRACAKILANADLAATPQALLEKQMRIIGPTLLKKDLVARGLTRKQIDAMGPPDLIVEKRSWQYKWVEHHYAVARVHAVIGVCATE